MLGASIFQSIFLSSSILIESTDFFLRFFEEEEGLRILIFFFFFFKTIIGNFAEYLCHGTWIENDTAYLVASTDVGRYCLVYSASATATGSRELSVTGHLASCPRAPHRHLVSWQVNLTSYGGYYQQLYK